MSQIKVPFDQEAERQVLGGLVLRAELFIEVSSIISRDDFYLEGHKHIFDAIQHLFNDGSTQIDSVQVSQYLQDRALIDKAGGVPYVMALSGDVISPSNVEAQARRLRSLALRRSLIDAASSIQDEAGQPSEDEGSFLRSVEDRILKITNSSFTQGIRSVKEMQKEFAEHLVKLQKNPGEITGTQTHFVDFDRLTSGLKGGELIVLAARPGMGKTTFALNIAANVATLNKKHVLVFSLEMGNIELMMRLVCAEAQFNHQDLKRGNISGSKEADLTNAVRRICAAPINIDDSGDLTIWDCMARTRKFKVELDQKGEELALIVIDYMQLMSDPESRKLGRQQEVANISRSLKQLAKAVDAPILALSQMNRSVEQRRGDARPQLSDLRESGAIEQDADIVMFIHKDAPENPETPEDLDKQGTVEVIIAKHRAGPIDNFRLAFRPQINRFDNRIVEEGGF